MKLQKYKTKNGYKEGILFDLKDIKHSQKDSNSKDKKELYFIFRNFLKRNFKQREQNSYDLFEITEFIYFKAKEHKTGDILIHTVFSNFIDYLINAFNFIEKHSYVYKNQNKLLHYIEKFPKPKIYRNYWKDWYLLWNILKESNQFSVDDDFIEIIKEHKAILGKYLSYKDTNSKNLKEYKEEYKEIIDFYKNTFKDFKPTNKKDFKDKAIDLLDLNNSFSIIIKNRFSNEN